MLSEIQCSLIEQGLTYDVEPRKVAAYLCLHMGLMLAEAAALQLRHIDLNNETICIEGTLGKADGSDKSAPVEFLPLDVPRLLPMPPHVTRYLKKHASLYQSRDCFVMSGDTSIPALYQMQNMLNSISKKQKIADTLSALDLRNAFIRRCIQSGVDLYTICTYIDIKQPNVITKRFAEYFEPKLKAVNVIEKYSGDYIRNPYVEYSGPKRMNLLILGAGSQGHVVKETAEAIGVFSDIAFLDDDRENKMAIDTCDNYMKYIDMYPIALPSFGNCQLRAKWIERLETAGFILPTLIHPMATVSPSATIGPGTIVEMKAIVGTNARVEKGCIISSGALIDLDACVDEYCHIGSAAAVKKNTRVESYTKFENGRVVESGG